MKSFAERLAEGSILISDGAIGTLLHAKGLGAGECPESWCLSHAEIVRGMAQDYIDAGSDIVETNSFGANRFKLELYGLADNLCAINRAAVALAREAAAGRAYVFGSIGPTGHILEEEGGEASPEAIYAAYEEQSAVLAEAGADAICAETMSSLAEARLAVQAAKAASGLPVLCTFAFEAGAKGFRTMMGVRPDRAARETVAAGADVVGANCGNGIAGMIEIARQMRAAVPPVPLLIHANAGTPVLADGRPVFRETPAYMASRVKELVEAGAMIIGGCCGTGPAHIAAMASVIRGLAARA
jgi:5-methyltetrahydrofolate--homocysteine methyltransferase